MSDGDGESAPEAVETAQSEASSEAREDYNNENPEHSNDNGLSELEAKVAKDVAELEGRESKHLSLEEYHSERNAKTSYAAEYFSEFYDAVVEPNSGIEQSVEFTHSHSNDNHNNLEHKVAEAKRHSKGSPEWKHLVTKQGKAKMLWDRIVNFVSTPFYYIESAINLFEEDAVAQKVKDMLENQSYLRDNTILIALHGSWQNGAGSYSRVMEIADKLGKTVIPLTYNYTKSNFESAEMLLEKIKEIKESTGANVIMVGHSQGADVGRAIMQMGGSRYIQRFVPFCGVYGFDSNKDKSVIKFLLSEHDMKGSYFQTKMAEGGSYGIPLNLYENWGLLIHGPSQKLAGVPNVPFNGGHMKLLYDDAGIRLLLDAAYTPEKVIGYAVNKPDPLTHVIDYKMIKEAELKKAA